MNARAIQLLVLFVATQARAELTVSSTTLIGGRPDLADGQVKTVTPIYERVGLRATHLSVKGFDDVSVSVDAWGGLTLNASEPDLAQSDVNLAHVEGRTFGNRLTLRLGRQLVTGGVARAMFFDGISAGVTLPAGFGLSAFTGVPVQRRFANFLRGDFVVGTRASFSPSYGTEVGVSFIHMLERGQVARQDVGFDGRWKIVRSLTVDGALVFSVADTRIAELDVGPRWSPADAIEIHAGYRRTAPDLFLPRTSIFTVFADTTRDDAGVDVVWQATSRIALSGEARALWLDGESGYEVGAQLQFRPFRAPRTALTAQFRRLSIPSNGFQLGRIGARHTLPFGLALSADLETSSLDRPVRGQAFSFSGSASASYPLSPSWLVAGTVFAATTPMFVNRYEAVLKLAYQFSSAGDGR